MRNIDFGSYIPEIVVETHQLFEERFGKKREKATPQECEQLVVDASKLVFNRTSLDVTIDYKPNSTQFPDIVYKFRTSQVSFGIEVKSSTTNNPSLTTLGNSILGSTNVPVSETYIVFIKMTDINTVVKASTYVDSVSDVVVTHSPRYKLDLSQSPEDSFFKKSGISYAELSASNDPIGKIQEYYKEQGVIAWWIAESTPATIRNWRELSPIEKEEIYSKAFAYFPVLLTSRNTNKYKNFAKWLAAEFSVVDSSLRDRFSAGGRVTIEENGAVFSDVSRVFQVFRDNFDNVMLVIDTESSDSLARFWNSFNQKNDSHVLRRKFWLKQVEKNLEPKEWETFFRLYSVLTR